MDSSVVSDFKFVIVRADARPRSQVLSIRQLSLSPPAPFVWFLIPPGTNSIRHTSERTNDQINHRRRRCHGITAARVQSSGTLSFSLSHVSGQSCSLTDRCFSLSLFSSLFCFVSFCHLLAVAFPSRSSRYISVSLSFSCSVSLSLLLFSCLTEIHPLVSPLVLLDLQSRTARNI